MSLNTHPQPQREDHRRKDKIWSQWVLDLPTLRHDVRELVRGRDVVNEVNVDLAMLRAPVVDGVCCHIDNTHVVTCHNRQSWLKRGEHEVPVEAVEASNTPVVDGVCCHIDNTHVVTCHNWQPWLKRGEHELPVEAIEASNTFFLSRICWRAAYHCISRKESFG
jgi:hypothetical protein